MEIIKVEKDLFKQTQEQNEQKYWASRKNVDEFESRCVDLHHDNNVL